MNINKISMEKRLSIMMNKGTTDRVENKSYTATFLKNLSCYGYTLSLECTEILETLSKDEIYSLHNELITIVKDIKGNKATIEPLYKNFPDEVMASDDVKLYIDAYIYALSNFTYDPSLDKKERFPLIDHTPLEVINLITREEFMGIFTNLVKSKSSIPAHDMALLKEYVEEMGSEILHYLPNKIYFKEILAHITSLCMHFKGADKYFGQLYTTGTDVLRLAVALSKGDNSLRHTTKFISFKRPTRRFLLSLLENSKDLEEHMKKNRGNWIALGETLHPGEYKQFPKVNAIFKKVRECKSLESFNSKITLAFENRDEKKALDLLSSRPGEFARRLDHTLREFKACNVLSAFEKIASKVSTPILLQVRAFYLKRNEDMDTRVFFPKGSLSKCYTIKNNITKLSPDIPERIVAISTEALLKCYKEKEELGKVYIDESLKTYIVPTQLRNSARSIKTLARGSRIAIGKDTKIFRLFLYWHESANQNNVDLDLSVGFLSNELWLKDSISYYNLSDTELNCCHSGDVRCAPNGASEFIDLDIQKLRDAGVRYATASVYSYTGEPFIDFKDCFMGYMERSELSNGEIYEPATVKNKVDIVADGNSIIPFIIDLETMEIVWTDMQGDIDYFSNDATCKNRLYHTTKAMLNCTRPTMYDLAFLNATARGEIVEDKTDADTIFSLEEGITPFDTDVILADYI